ncbi:MAG: glycosyltransferase [Phocaeicola sp.]|nr:glycosyltransferase [Phocaeicola sp.]
MKISIVTITYNSANTLEDTIKSVLTQTYPNIEYIIKDGNSSDKTIDIIKKYEPLFNGRMKWISEKDEGIYDAMNKGIQIATGEVVGILNSDDFFTTNDIISKIADSFNANHSIDATYGDVHFVHENNLNICTRYYSSKVFKRGLMRMGLMPAHPSFYCKKKIFDRFGYYKTDYKIAADFEFLLRTIFKGKIHTMYIPLDMVTMRAGGASTSGLISHKLIMKEHLRAFKENGVYTNILILSLRYFYKIWELMNTKIGI